MIQSIGLALGRRKSKIYTQSSKRDNITVKALFLFYFEADNGIGCNGTGPTMSFEPHDNAQ